MNTPRTRRHEDRVQEAFVLWPAYNALQGWLSNVPAIEADPYDWIGLIAGMGADRAVSYLHALEWATDLRDAHATVTELLAMAHDGCRPCYASELGLVPEDWRR